MGIVKVRMYAEPAASRKDFWMFPHVAEPVTPPLCPTLNAHEHRIVSCKSRRLTFLENDESDAADVPGPDESRLQR